MKKIVTFLAGLAMMTSIYAAEMIIQPGDRIHNRQAGYTFSMQPNENTNPVTSVFEQSKQKYDKLVLTIGPTHKTGFLNGDVYLREVKKYPKFTHIYIYDELFWTGSAIQIGKDEESVNIAAGMVRAIGLKPALSIMPRVILNPAFNMVSINAVDVIAIDMYPGIFANVPTPGCSYNANIYTTQFYCAYQKLRQKGFTGEIWYVYQAFGLKSADKTLQAYQFSQQREAVDFARQQGLTTVPFGLFLSPAALAAEPDLYQGFGSDIEPLIGSGF